jgi:hypothetical protein
MPHHFSHAKQISLFNLNPAFVSYDHGSVRIE